MYTSPTLIATTDTTDIYTPTQVAHFPFSLTHLSQLTFSSHSTSTSSKMFHSPDRPVLLSHFDPLDLLHSSRSIHPPLPSTISAMSQLTHLSQFASATSSSVAFSGRSVRSPSRSFATHRLRQHDLAHRHCAWQRVGARAVGEGGEVPCGCPVPSLPPRTVMMSPQVSHLTQ